MELKYKPLGNRIVGKIKNVTEHKSAKGIILVQDQHNFVTAEVLEVGRGYVQPDGHITPTEVRKGDIVYIPIGVGYVMPDDDHPDLAEDEFVVIFSENDIITKKI